MIFYSHRRIRKWVFRGVLALLMLTIVFVAADFAFGLFAASARRSAQVDVNYYYNVIGDQKVIALTFDDGPLPGRTETLMNTLQEENVPATFFFIGSRALRFPALVKEAADRGFEIGNHTFSHAQTVHTSQWRLNLELNLTDTIIESTTRQQVRLYRPPFLLDVGSDPTTTFPGSKESLYWATEDGYVVVGADMDPKDWLATSEQDVADRFFEHLSPGRHIVLLHDGSSEHYTVAAMKKIIDGLRERGYTFATVSQLLGLDAAPTLLVNRDLKVGDKDTKTDTNVANLQRFLITHGFPIDDQNGVYGSSTERAVTAWQTRKQITTEKNFVGPETRAAIGKVVASTMYQPIKPTNWQNVFLFGQVTHLYVALAPFIVHSILWLTKVVLALVMARLGIMLLLRTIVAFKKRPRHKAWTNGVSVIIPAYNEEDNIHSTIMSILESSVEELEILVMNDGSKDRTGAIVQEIEKQYPKKVRLYNLKNGGKARALNYGFRLARYDVVVTMDGDTVFDRYAIARLARHFHDPNVMAVAGKVCATNSRNILNLFQWAEYVITQNMDKEALNLVNAIGVVPGPVGAWRRSVVLEVGGYSLDTMVEDQDLTLALIARGYRVLYEPQALAYSETPFFLKDFYKQRSRWIFGTLQCVWKYKRYLLSFRRPAMGWAVLLNTIIFSFFLSLLIPLMDFLLVIALLVGFARSTFLLYLLFVGIDLLYATFGFWREKSKKWLIVTLPVQRLFYRFIIAVVVWRSVIKAIEGAESQWNKVRKRGDAQAHHLHMTGTHLPQPATSAPPKS